MEDYPEFRTPIRYDTKVYVGDEGDVIISQGDLGDDGSAIILAEDQLPTIINWLRQIQAALKANPFPGR